MSTTRAAFLDRDGTLIVERAYLAEPDAVELLPGVIDGLRALRAAGYLLIVITNQSGLARGLFTFADYEAVRTRLDALLAEGGVALDDVYVCPHHPDITGACDCRKPATALYRLAAHEHGIDLARSAFIGDKGSDVEPAVTLGGTGILVRTGHGAAHEAAVPPQVRVVDDFAAAVRTLVRNPPASGLASA